MRSLEDTDVAQTGSTALIESKGAVAGAVAAAVIAIAAADVAHVIGTRPERRIDDAVAAEAGGKRVLVRLIVAKAAGVNGPPTKWLIGAVDTCVIASTHIAAVQHERTAGHSVAADLLCVHGEASEVRRLAHDLLPRAAGARPGDAGAVEPLCGH